MELTTLLYQIGLSIKSVSTKDTGNGIIKINFKLEYNEDDYYIYDRLEARFKFEIRELIEIQLISMT
jgi:hypothetical protein